MIQQVRFTGPEFTVRIVDPVWRPEMARLLLDSDLGGKGGLI